MATVSLPDQLAAVRREIGMRKRVYIRWVQTEKMTQAKADHEIAAMEAVAGTLQALVDAQAPPLFG